ncbi:MAG: hypothetical protein JXB10_09075 [Pirellulales bacterium]|nr:hypothetical protein [Pirellulales bacterium]
MGRKRKNENVEAKEKKSPIKVKPIPRMHAGKVTEPWRIMERLIAECTEFAHLKVAKIKLWWQRDWKADVDGIATGAQVCKASEIDRNLAEESSGETVDLFIKLPEVQWPTLDDAEKEHRLYHELLHIMSAKDFNGNQKRDSKDRLLWRLRKHPIQAFHEEIERYGADKVIGHNAAIVASIAHAERPMEKIFDRAEEGDSQGDKKTPDTNGWRKVRIDSIGLSTRYRKAFEEAGIKTLGKASDIQQKHGDFWQREISGLGDKGREEYEDRMATFWGEHPEYCGQ